MKCLKRNGKVIRVGDKKAMDLINKDWEYCPKHEWKDQRKNK